MDDCKPDVLRLRYGPLQLTFNHIANKYLYSDAGPETAVYAWVGPEASQPTDVIVIPQLCSVKEMITDKYMLRVRTHVGLDREGVPALRTAYIYRQGPDLVVGSLYYTDSYPSGLQMYESVRLLHTAPTGSEYLLLPLDEGETVERLTKGVPNVQVVYDTRGLPVRSMGVRLNTPTLADDDRDLDTVLNELRGGNGHTN